MQGTTDGLAPTADKQAVATVRAFMNTIMVTVGKFQSTEELKAWIKIKVRDEKQLLMCQEHSKSGQRGMR